MADRRQILTGTGMVSLALGAGAVATQSQASAVSPKAFARKSGPRMRVMVVNDLSGDIDGLFATVHALLSPSAQVCGIVGTAALFPTETADQSVENANEILRLMNLSGQVPVHLGAPHKMSDSKVPVDCPGARAIIAEAMRDNPLPLYVTVGGGLTEVASALLLEPKIADRFTLVWIGGDSHDKGGAEYNFNLDRKAAQLVFNESQVALWQVTSQGYATCEVSATELQAHVMPYGPIGAWLFSKIAEGIPMLEHYGINEGETWTLGDSPLVLLTALTSWVPSGPPQQHKYERTSSPYDEVYVPHLRDDGSYEPRTEGRRMRVFNSVDTRLMFGDFFAKMQMNFGR